MIYPLTKMGPFPPPQQWKWKMGPFKICSLLQVGWAPLVHVSVQPSGQSHPLPMLPWNRHRCTPGIFWELFVDSNLWVCFLGMAGAHRPSWRSDHCVFTHPCRWFLMFEAGANNAGFVDVNPQTFQSSLQKEHHEM